MNKSLFTGEDFDAADHIGEIRKRPVTPNGLRVTATGRIVNDRMELFGKALEQQRVLARPLASVAKCDHDWPEDKQGTDMNGSCTKCGMSFMLYIHSECP